MQLTGSFSALVPVVVRLIHSPPPLGAACAARVYRVLAAVVSSLQERTRYFTLLDLHDGDIVICSVCKETT